MGEGCIPPRMSTSSVRSSRQRKCPHWSSHTYSLSLNQVLAQIMQESFMNFEVGLGGVRWNFAREEMSGLGYLRSMLLSFAVVR